MKPFSRIIFSCLLIFGLLIGCSHQKLAEYEEFADFVQPGNDRPRLPVVIVPGVKGSILKRGKNEVWGKSYRVAFLHTFDELRFPITAQLDDNFNTDFGIFYDKCDVRDGGIMQKYRIALRYINLFDISIYKNLKDVLEKSGGYSKGNDLFMFSYDWRLDNRISAAHLAYKVKEYQKLYLKHIKKALFINNDKGYNEYIDLLKANGWITEDGLVKVNLITHSMGGLVSRYYLQVLGGENNVNKLIMLGSPNQGAMDALKAIAKGEFPESIVHFYRKEKTRPIIFSWPSTYQLLPRYLGCIKNGNWQDSMSLDAWGLGHSYPNDDGNISDDQVILNWVNHDLIPASFRKKEITSTILNTYLKEQLVSAAKFHGAMNGNIDKTYEQEKIESINVFAKAASLPVKIDAEFIYRPAKTPFILFGGHCEPTLKYACSMKTEDNKKLLRFDNPRQKQEDKISFTMGDGRVPISSLRVTGRTNSSDFQFLMCEGHTSMVSNTTFQYNLLRELLWQASCLR